MPIEPIRNVNLEEQCLSLAERSLLQKAEVFIDIPVVSYFTDYPWNVAERVRSAISIYRP